MQSNVRTGAGLAKSKYYHSLEAGRTQTGVASSLGRRTVAQKQLAHHKHQVAHQSQVFVKIKGIFKALALAKD